MRNKTIGEILRLCDQWELYEEEAQKQHNIKETGLKQPGKVVGPGSPEIGTKMTCQQIRPNTSMCARYNATKEKLEHLR